MEKWAHHFACALAGVVVALVLGGAVAPSAQASCASPANEIEAENCLPGSPSSQWDVWGNPNVEGFATDISVAQGGTVRFKIDAGASYTLDIYRMGYYGGDGARRITSLGSKPAQAQPTCANQAATGLEDCGNWAESANWAVPSDAASGIYFARVESSSGANHIVFVVRDDDGASDLLFQTSDTTWQAYNHWGGNSLYTGSPDGRAYKVSYNRPFSTREYASEDWVFNAEYPMVRWLERNGYDVSYATGVDSDRSGAELREHKTFLSVGHDEYWSGVQRANVEAARDAGVNLAFFSGNEVFWKTRWEDNHRTLVTYKETHANQKIDPLPNEWTGTWRDPRSFNPQGGRPENALTGTIFTVNSGSAALEVPADDGKLRFWRGTPVAQQLPGAVATLTEDAVGYEWDEDLDNGARPAGLMRLSSTTKSGVDKLQDYGTNYSSGTATHSLTLYRDTNGSGPDALVFGAGTVQWSWGLDQNHDRGSQATSGSMQQATVNLFADMGVQPRSLQGGLTTASASTDTTAPTPTITAPTQGASVEQRIPIAIQGTAVDAARVGGVEVSVDNGVTWHPATGRETWTYSWTPTAGGPVTIRARAVDDSGNLSAATPGTTVNVTGRSCPCSLFGGIVPADTTANDATPIEVGVRFRSDQSGTITALRYYKGAGWTGTRTGHLWAADGTPLATAQFTGESASGWQQAPLSQPVPITAGTTYVASYFSSTGSYAADLDFFAEPYDAVPLHAPTGDNGVYVYGGGFPNATSRSTNYWADVVFAPADAVPPSVTARVPAPGSTDVAAGSTVRATFNEALIPASVSASTFKLRTAGGDTVAASVTYAGSTATLTPAAPLTAGALYTATVDGVQDLAGNPLAQPVSWSFTVAPATPDPDPEPEPGSEPNDQPPDTTPPGSGGSSGAAGSSSGGGSAPGSGASSGVAGSSAGGGPGAAPAAALKVRLRPRTARVSRRGAVKLKVICPDGAGGCRVRLRLRYAGRIAASHRLTLAGGERARVRLKLRRRALRALARRGSLRVTAVAVSRDPGGDRTTTRKRVRLKTTHATGAA